MRYFLLSIAILLTISCTIRQKLSDNELNIIKRAISSKEITTITEAKLILDTRIRKFNFKNDVALKMQVLLSAKEYDIALEESAKFMKQFPDYIEMIVLHCVLSKYILPSDEATIIYQQSIEQIQIIAENLTNLQQKYNALVNLLLLYCLFNDMSNKQLCLSEISNLQISQEEKVIIEQISKSTESELFVMCNIY
ncbi:hypothetical protein [Treponema vincentii]|uniref:hypothetical protein n=1 Tax=Treponema vincentii TaxID=69710 RepID=UPI0020A5DCAB|nr:hypothetical protein [Treponema vincentii]UTC48861.1 hypothetical protein E4N73_08435 [Treponema vincentii]